MYELQCKIEHIFGKNHIREQVLKDIDPESNLFASLVDNINNYRNKTYSYTSKNKRLKALTVSSDDLAIELIIAVITIEPTIVPVQVVISKLIPHLKCSNLIDGVKIAGEIIAVCEGDLFTLHHNTDLENETDTLGIKPKFQVKAHTQDFINNTKYLPPMICKPIPWKGNTGYGNVTGSGSVILGTGNDEGQNQNLLTINILQSIEWELNEEMLEFMEVSKKALDTIEKRQNFDLMVNSSEVVYKDLLEQGNKFYLVWKYDFRGRSYSQGYHVNLQSNSYRKAIMNFKHKELITDEIIL